MHGVGVGGASSRPLHEPEVLQVQPGLIHRQPDLALLAELQITYAALLTNDKVPHRITVDGDLLYLLPGHSHVPL